MSIQHRHQLRQLRLLTIVKLTAANDRRLDSYSATVVADSAGAAFWKDCLMDARLSDISRMFSRVTGRSVDAA